MFDFKLMSPILWPVEDTLPPLKSPSKSCKSQENINKSTISSFKKRQFLYRAIKTGGGGYKSPHKIMRNCLHYTLTVTPQTVEIKSFHICYKILKDLF